ncbi:hypothetical protein LLG95_10400 [bacterium]|nr:hypothetical protein [bacterium]
MVEIDKALDQIQQIHEHLARAEMCRDWRSGPVACGGALAIAAAAAQGVIIGAQPEPRLFVVYWVILAAIAALIAGAGMIKSYFAQPNPILRRRTRILAGQFAPCIAVGAVATAALAGSGAAAIQWLPGLWALIFSLGTFASRPYLPRIIGWVGLFYIVAGGVLLMLGARGEALSPWCMGLTFGPGQLVTGLVLYWNLERNGGRAES